MRLFGTDTTENDRTASEGTAGDYEVDSVRNNDMGMMTANITEKAVIFERSQYAGPG